MEPQAASNPAFDLTAFAQVFFEEAAEHLAALESQLVALDPADASDDELNAIFRAAHSVKGGAATFGFKDMAEVTHEAESLLDRARRRETTLTPEMIDALLAARDVLSLQLDRHRSGGAGEAPDSAPACARIRAFLEQPVAMAPEKSDRPQAAEAPARAERRIEVLFPNPDDPAKREALEAALRELGDTGEPCTIPHEPPAVRCAVVLTALDPEALREALSFVVDPGSLTLIEHPEPAAAAPSGGDGYGFFDPAPAPAAKVEEAGYGFFDEPAPPAPAAPAAAKAPAKPARPEPKAATAENLSIRVGVDKVDQLINQMGELVITQAMLAQTTAALDPIVHARLVNGLRDLERNTRDLQESVMSIRMMPIASVFNRFPRMARELAAQLGKQVALVMEGESTELDKGVIEKLSDPLTHLVRNAIDHGVELPADREAAGKPAQGTVTLKAFQQGGSIVVEIGDDGAGLRRERILAKAKERGIAIAENAADSEVFALIFAAGFSTAEKVTDVSGRGVGMDVVKKNITALGGVVEIASAPGTGTRVTVRLPLTLAIMDGMSVAVGATTYILPLASVVESLQPGSATTRPVAGSGRVVQVREEYLPVVAMREVYPDHAAPEAAREILIVVEAEGAKAALLVDELVGQQQVVVKNIETHYRKVPGVSGATILGDGTVALILDVPALVKRSRH